MSISSRTFCQDNCQLIISSTIKLRHFLHQDPSTYIRVSVNPNTRLIIVLHLPGFPRNCNDQYQFWNNCTRIIFTCHGSLNSSASSKAAPPPTPPPCIFLSLQKLNFRKDNLLNKLQNSWHCTCVKSNVRNWPYARLAPSKWMNSY